MDKLPVTEELDFAYLLELMPPLHHIPEFAWLPELFSIIGYEKLILLCKYAGGESITLPTVEQLADSIDVLQLIYDIYIKRNKSILDVPPSLKELFDRASEVYNAQYNQELHE